jgi:hypothetical protein
VQLGMSCSMDDADRQMRQHDSGCVFRHVYFCPEERAFIIRYVNSRAS